MKIFQLKFVGWLRLKNSQRARVVKKTKWTEKGHLRPKRIEQNKIELNKTEEDQIRQNRTKHERMDQTRLKKTEEDQMNGPNKIEWTNYDRIRLNEPKRS